MSDRQENGMLAIAAGVLIILIALCMMSCATKRKVGEYVAVHDTTVVYRTDTVRLETVRQVTDTLREMTVREVTLMRDTAGNTDTVRIETFRDHYRYIYKGDSLSVYRVAVDSILRALDRHHEKQTVKVSPVISLWQYIVYVLAVLVACVAVLRYKSK